MRACTYARYSSDAQNASSIEDQERNCRRRAETENWKIVTRFADEAMTASNNRRPQYLAMQQAAARKEFDILLLNTAS